MQHTHTLAVCFYYSNRCTLYHIAFIQSKHLIYFMRNVLCEVSNQFLLQLRNHYREGNTVHFYTNGYYYQ